MSGERREKEVAVSEIAIQATADVDGRAVLGPGTTVWHLAQIRENLDTRALEDEFNRAHKLKNHSPERQR